MQLDDVVSSVNDDFSRFKLAMERSVRWLDRCISAHKKSKTQSLFPIIQGGLDISPGKVCAIEKIAINICFGKDLIFFSKIF